MQALNDTLVMVSTFGMLAGSLADRVSPDIMLTLGVMVVSSALAAAAAWIATIAVMRERITNLTAISKEHNTTLVQHGVIISQHAERLGRHDERLEYSTGRISKLEEREQ